MLYRKKNKNLSINDNIRLKCAVIDDSVLIGV